MLDAILNGTNLFGDPIKAPNRGPVAERFGFPPFSVFDARSGDWQDRKRAWISVGIKSEMGRDAACYNTGGPGTLSAAMAAHVRPTERGDYWQEKMGNEVSAKETGTSIFDPTLCECVYRWFSCEGAQVIDPFAGGSVRGIVAGMLGRRYWGCDLRQEQIAANNQQASAINPEVYPTWVCGDSIETLDDAPPADLVFSCPPYGDLERYSDNPADLSTMEWHTFRAQYARIILRSVGKLKQDRFACFVVGDFRDNRGFYRDFVSATIASFRDAGAELYNEAILVTPVGSACMRVTKQFDSGRKFAKTHQNVLVFCKGDWRKAAAAARRESA
jgi:hypothetical protein